jgi:hypothetical protein
LVRAGHRIFDADIRIIEPVEPVEEYLTAAHRAKLGAHALRGPASTAAFRGVVMHGIQLLPPS